MRVERDIADPVGFTCWVLHGFLTRIDDKCTVVLVLHSKNELMILYFINVVDDINKIEPFPTIGRLND